MPLTLNDFDYKLPSALIAQKPLVRRDQSRLLVIDKKTSVISHRHFFDLLDYLKAGDVLVVNNSKVLPARLMGTKEISGGKIEIFLHQKIKNDLWECLVGGKVKEGMKINFSDSFDRSGGKSIDSNNNNKIIKKKLSKFQATLIKNNNDGTWQVKFNVSGSEFNKLVQEIGQVPLPPYIKRAKQLASDKKTYQTVYAVDEKIGSVAAPTAGLHFTNQLLKKIKAKGVEILEVTLQVGLGTFATVKTDNIKNHQMHSELVEIKKDVLKKISKAKQAGRRIIAVGTTSCRTLESWGQTVDINSLDIKSIKADFKTATSIFIYPPYKFKVVDALITNFHLPKSTLLMLVSALAGKSNIDKAYRVAVAEKYRFFSYGDAMLIGL